MEITRRRANWVMIALLAVYLVDAVLSASIRPFWHDEMITFHVSQLQPAGIWQALLAGADAQPPVIHLITRASQFLFGKSELATRLPLILAFTGASWCFFRFLVVRLGGAPALSAVVFLWISGAYRYATEARPYGIVLFCAAASLLCYRAICEDRHRRLALGAFFLALVTAIASHYYAVWLLVPFGCAELLRIRRRRKIDLPIAVCLVAALAPLFVYLPLLRAVAQLRGSFWQPVSWTQGPLFYFLSLENAWLPALNILIVGAFLFVRGRNAPRGPALFPETETVVLVVLAVIPLLALLPALLVTRAFVNRYFLYSLLALCTGVAVVVKRLDRFRGTPQVALALLCLFFGAVRLEPSLQDWWERPATQFSRQFGALAAAGSQLPIVVADPVNYMTLRHYAPPALAPRIVYLAESKLAMKYRHTDTAEMNLVSLKGRAPLRVEPFQGFIDKNPEFLVFYDITPPVEWLTRKLADDGKSLEMVERAPDFQVMKCCGSPVMARVLP